MFIAMISVSILMLVVLGAVQPLKLAFVNA
jgi:hypothetical protein